jgi:hypothetical protein
MFPGCRRPTSNKRDSGTLQVAAQRYGSMKYRKKEVTVARGGLVLGLLCSNGDTPQFSKRERK